MKDYSLKINGQNYTVQIDEVNDASTVAHVVVNGTAYEVEIEGAKTSAASRPQVVPAPKEANASLMIQEAADLHTAPCVCQEPLQCARRQASLKYSVHFWH